MRRVVTRDVVGATKGVAADDIAVVVVLLRLVAIVTIVVIAFLERLDLGLQLWDELTCHPVFRGKMY